MSEHARLAPSSAHRWMRCAGSIALEANIPDTESPFAIEGSAAHALAECVLLNRLDPTVSSTPITGGTNATDYVGTYPLRREGTPQVTTEMADFVQTYVDTVWSLAQGHTLLVEQRVDFSDAVGVEEQFGTADAIILHGKELQIHDLKYGLGVKVYAEHNEQLQLYALGALAHFGLIEDFETVRMFIHQPRLYHVSEWAISVEDLEAFGERAREAATSAIVAANIAGCEGVETLPVDTFTPGEKQCRFCKARGGLCASETQATLEIIKGDFVDLTQPVEEQITAQPVTSLTSAQLAEIFGKLEFVESWAKAVKSRVNAELSAGHEVPGYKLVLGKQGNRAWLDETEAAKMLERFKLKKEERYTIKLISPTSAETLLKKEKPRQWETLKALITRTEGKPTVAPESDPRPALIINTINDFDDVEATESLI